MGQYFAADYTGAPFVLFGPEHLAALGLLLLLLLAVIPLRRLSAPRPRAILRYSLAGLLILSEASWQVWCLVYGQWSIQTNLPLHLCSISFYLTVAALLTGYRSLYAYVYFLGAGGALPTVLTPDLGIYGFPHFRFFQILIAHGLIVFAGVYLNVVEGGRPTLKSLRDVVIGLNLYMLGIAVVDRLLGANYLFLVSKPEPPTPLDYMGPWPWYILGMEAVGVVLFLLMYAPFALRGRSGRPAPAG